MLKGMRPSRYFRKLGVHRVRARWTLHLVWAGSPEDRSRAGHSLDGVVLHQGPAHTRDRAAPPSTPTPTHRASLCSHALAPPCGKTTLKQSFNTTQMTLQRLRSGRWRQ